MGILSPIPTYIINIFFFTFSVYQDRLILSIGFLHILMYQRYREIPFMT